ncbi:hypothetical protein ACIQMR_30240 [Streptomyces sp. NPDC091376]|uniref:hypothetical protein n=1 Tax=Streptomyces sp. NPDC091376 TaxID=3365994 RepID=UPI003815C90C
MAGTAAFSGTATLRVARARARALALAVSRAVVRPYGARAGLRHGLTERDGNRL